MHVLASSLAPMALVRRARPATPRGTPAAVVVDAATVRVGGRTILDAARMEVPAGTLVAIAGGSGSGKTTLLEVMAGARRPTSGQVLLAGGRLRAAEAAGSGRVGLVPQDDVIHRDLPLRRTLLHAARLRIGRGAVAGPGERVDEVLDRLGLGHRGDVTVGALSGGQRKRASIAVELLTRPEVLFLDEPTSGLDPVSAREVIDALVHLARTGTTVVMTTHHPDEIARCDRVAFLARDGHLCFEGTPADAAAYFEVDDLSAVYSLVDRGDPAEWGRRWEGAVARSAADRTLPPAPLPTRSSSRPAPERAGRLRQWSVLTARGAEVMVRNRLTLAILLGSPALVITMMAVLFPAGVFGGTDTASVGPAQTVFWIAFATFFFGLTYGLLQIVTERAVLRRDRFAGMDLTAYLASKVTVLAPVLAAVAVGLLGVLRVLDRLPAAGWGTYAEMFAASMSASLAGLAIGLAASAAVAHPAQATLALPMICFPQVLFAGAVASGWATLAVITAAGLAAALAVLHATTGPTPRR